MIDHFKEILLHSVMLNPMRNVLYGLCQTQCVHSGNATSRMDAVSTQLKVSFCARRWYIVLRRLATKRHAEAQITSNSVKYRGEGGTCIVCETSHIHKRMSYELDFVAWSIVGNFRAPVTQAFSTRMSTP